MALMVTLMWFNFCLSGALDLVPSSVAASIAVLAQLTTAAIILSGISDHYLRLFH